MNSFPKHLLDGHRDFMQGRYANERGRYHELADEGQKPSTMVIACCDSRATPEMIFGAGPGEMFVLRNVANLVPQFEPDGGQHGTSAGIEFATQVLGVKNIIIMGHGRCGGIKAALDPAGAPLAEGDFIGKWLTLLEPVRKQFGDNRLMTSGERQTILERISIRNSVNNLRSFPYVKKAEEEGRLNLHGAWFDIKTGELWIMDNETGEFERPEI
ncbi:MAG: carbonic anhydrase [Hyphomicrobiaceae bacterium]|nr:carbonic anhydrase [Hyphomicrobiaceae bacterium]MCC0024362.1 carbonic anhydrase [Hyphomicrobiaceae bacterium]